jgi:hypothetical protein
MPSFSPTQQALNTSLYKRLAEAGCQRGRLDISRTLQLSLAGQKPNGKTIYFWEFSRSFQGLVDQYLTESLPDGFAQVTVLVDVNQAYYTYSVITLQQQAAIDAAAQQEDLRAKLNRPRSRTPFGLILAKQVAEVLTQGSRLVHSHRDYCGMGFIYRNAQFLYGEVWDGDYLEAPQLTFSDRTTFADWLARQSNYSLARLEEADPWYWDNQTITRQRLEEFVAGQ